LVLDYHDLWPSMDPASDRRGPTSVEPYLRSLAPRTGRDRVTLFVRWLDHLAVEGAVDDVRIRVTGEAVPASPGGCVTTVGASRLERLVRFRDWATLTGQELGQGFDRTSVHSSFAGRDYDAIVPPTLRLAEYERGRLRFVTPRLEG
jgi:hypothetical protein